MLEGDISEISSETIRALHEVAEHISKTKDYRITVSLASKAGADNFTGTIYRVSFRSHGEDGKNREQKMFLKVASGQLEWRDQVSARQAYLQEKYMYGTVCSFGKWLISDF